MRYHLLFQHKTETKNESLGDVVETWKDAFRLDAEIMASTSREFFDAQQRHAEMTMLFRSRYKAIADSASYRILFTFEPDAHPLKYQIYDIWPPRPDNKKQYMFIEAKEHDVIEIVPTPEPPIPSPEPGPTPIPPIPGASPEAFFTSSDAESVTVMAAALGIDVSPGANRFYYNGIDSPEGGFMIWLFEALNTNAFDVMLPTTLPAGTWYLFVYGYDYDANNKLDVSLGSADAAQQTLDDRDAVSKLWSMRFAFTTTVASNVLHFTLRRGSLAGDLHFLFRGLYITSNSDVTMTAQSVAVNLNYPTVMSSAAPVKGNLIRNGGFETGIDAEWGWIGQGSGLTVPLQTMWNNTGIGHSGGACLRVTNNVADRIQPANNAIEIISRVYHLKPNKQYTLSGWFKKPVGGTGTVTLRLRNTYIPPAGYPGQYQVSSDDVIVGSSWVKIVIPPSYLIEYPTSDYQIVMSLYVPDGAELLIDDLQLEEGAETAFAPASTLEAAVRIDMSARPGNIFWDSETVQGTLIARNEAATTQSGTFHYEIYDHFNRLVTSGTVALSIAAHATHTETFSLGLEKIGIFRLVSWIGDRENTERELTYSVIPEPSTSGVDLTSHVGISPNFTAFQLATLRKMGVKWIRVMSPEVFGRWIVAEPADDAFVFFDAKVALAATYGMTTMITLGTNNYWPAWAASGSFFNLDKWGEFCGQMAAHYAPIGVHHWEIWNEPFVFLNTGQSGIDFYAQMLKRAADAILAADPTATIIGMGGIELNAMQSVIASIVSQFPTWNWFNDVKVLATHAYVGAVPPESFTTPIIDAYGVNVWNTETGVWDLTFRNGASSNFVSWGKNVWPHTDGARYYVGNIGAAAAVIENFARTVAAKMGVYFYYDSRLYASPDYFLQHPTIFDYDGTPKAKGIAYAIAGSLIGHAVGMGNASADPHTYALMFDTGGLNPIAFLVASDRKPKQMTLALISSQFEVLDMMGNQVLIAGTTIPFGRVPLYVRGLGISAATLFTAMTAAVTSRADTLAPFISIVDGPRGPVTDEAGRFRVRWIGGDDTSYPNLGEVNTQTGVLNDVPDPEALVYSTRLDPFDTWSAYTPATFRDFATIPAGTYTFSVKCKDRAGNVAQADRTVVIA